MSYGFLFVIVILCYSVQIPLLNFIHLIFRFFVEVNYLRNIVPKKRERKLNKLLCRKGMLS